jgi:hypothetical protein
MTDVTELEPERDDELAPATESDRSIDDAPGDEAPSAGGRSRWRLVAILVPVVLVLAVALLAVQDHRYAARESRGAEARAEVGASLTELLSWTPSTAASDLLTERDLLTGEFASQYAKLVRDTIAPSAEKSGLTSKAEITASGVVTPVAGDRVVLLYFVNVTVTGPASSRGSASGSAQPYKSVVGSRIEVTAVYRDGHWLIERYDPV